MSEYFDGDQERARRGMDDWSSNQIKYTGTFNTATPPKPTPEQLIYQQVTNAEQRMNNKIDAVQTSAIRNIDRLGRDVVAAQTKTDYHAATTDARIHEIDAKVDKHAEAVDSHAEAISDMRQEFQDLKDQMIEVVRANERLRRENTSLTDENENLREQNFEYIEENEELQGDLGTMADMLKETRDKLDETTQKLRDATHTGEGFKSPQQEMYDTWMKRLGTPPAAIPNAGRIMYTTTTNRTNSMTPAPSTAPDDPVETRRRQKEAMFASIYGGNPFRNRGTAR